MSEWKTVAHLDELPAEGGHSVRMGNKEIALFLTGGEVHALDNLCPHQGFPLSDGWIEDKTITCPWHGWQFNAATGECLIGGCDVETYEVRVENGVVQLKIEE